MTRGYLTFAQNNDTVDYLRLAYVQALSIKATQSINSCAVVVDANTMKAVTDNHRQVFDYIIPMPGNDDAADDQWKLKNEWKALLASPFDETIKVESDMLFTANIDHWWDIMSALDVCFTTDVVNYQGKVSSSRAYRKVFDVNNLLNVYNGFYYFKKTPAAKEFFGYARDVFTNWDYVKSEILVGALDQVANTDLVFAVAAKLIDDKCYLPTQAVPRFVHMKGAINGFGTNEDWRNKIYCQFDQETVTVGATRQAVPFHYHYKDFITDEIVTHYETLTKKETHC